jgi:lyso-ornithine lipid O-acyltransferase
MMTEPIIGKFRCITRTAGMGAWTFGTANGARLHEKLAQSQEGYRVWQQWIRVWARGLVALFGMDDVSASPVPSPAKGARLVVSNHRSPMDIPILVSLCGGHFLSRGDITQWPIIGSAARSAGTVFVDREDARSGISAIRQMRSFLKQGRTLIVFPEGTTFAGDDVRPFQAGVFSAVRGLNVEIIPVGIAYQPGTEFVDKSFIQYLNRVATNKKTRVAINFGKARPARGNHNEIAAAMRKEVQELVNGARKMHDASDPHM